MKFLRSTSFVLFFCIIPNFIWAQYKVTFRVKPPPMHFAEPVFIAGNFNNWNPNDSAYTLQVDQTANANYTATLPPGNYEFKFTRGGWNKVESTKEGKSIGNRFFSLHQDTIIFVTISGWSDDFKQEVVVKKHTASSNVKILDTAFLIPQLNRKRRIWIYLPADYATTKQRFPVLYMHDGQNLFDEATAGFGEWGVDECLDSLSAKGKKECIVIGIDNGPKRMSEYNPYEFQKFGKGEGNDYVDFLAKSLKPFIDSHFRTLSGKKNTFIAGSSMGGLISLYAVAKYPSIFGGAGIFSPAFWTAPALDSAIKIAALKMKSRLFFYAGGREGGKMVPDMKRIEEEIKSLSKSKIKEIIDEEAKHNEVAWRKYFPQVYLWLVND